MAKLNFLEVVCTALFASAVLWQATSSNAVWSTVTEETLTTTKGPDVCHEISCPLGRHCVLNTTENRPECVCNDICPALYAPVCGSDGQTYDNDCLLGVAACKTNTYITVEHRESCKGTTSSISLGPDSPTVTEETLTTATVCTGFECPYYGQCVVDSDNRPTCVCRLACEKILWPVCGSNNKTYDNECLLQAEACQTKTNTSVVHEGKCNDRHCTGVGCPFYGQCVLDDYNRTTCVCPMGCPKIYLPVCGCNNKTYTNECELRSDSCLTNTRITVLHFGRCDGGYSCDGVTCSPGKLCQLNHKNEPECICGTVCTTEYAPVCGSDGKTYGNRCVLYMTACQTNTSITVVHEGECKTASSSTVPGPHSTTVIFKKKQGQLDEVLEI